MRTSPVRGIRCAHRTTDVSAESGLQFGGWREVVVSTADEAHARELLAATPWVSLQGTFPDSMSFSARGGVR